VTWKVVLLSDVSFPTFDRSKPQNKFEVFVPIQNFNRSLLGNRNLEDSDCIKCREKVGWAQVKEPWWCIAGCSLRSVLLTVLRPASIYCLVLRIACVSRKHTMPPKPAAMAAWLGKAKEGESGTMIHSPAVSATLLYGC